jgi:hypothetical protein
MAAAKTTAAVAAAFQVSDTGAGRITAGAVYFDWPLCTELTMSAVAGTVTTAVRARQTSKPAGFRAELA